MSVQLQDLVEYLDGFLNVPAFQDYCPNGLQVEGASEVKKIISGVTANQALIERAIEEKADAILVHHGFFWKGESPEITGMKAKRIGALMRNNISLLAYHLPLDANPELGNNVQLAKLLGLELEGGLNAKEVLPIAVQGKLTTACELSVLGAKIAAVLKREPLMIGDLSKNIKRVAWCTGAAQSYFSAACDAGVDCFITGEISEPMVHIAQERGVAYISAGHHATERYGAMALGEHLAAKFDLCNQFVDISSPV